MFLGFSNLLLFLLLVIIFVFFFQKIVAPFLFKRNVFIWYIPNIVSSSTNCFKFLYVVYQYLFSKNLHFFFIRFQLESFLLRKNYKLVYYFNYQYTCLFFLQLQHFQKVLAPFLLRRTKNDVDVKLPPKREIMVKCPMSKLQHQYYEAIVDQSIKHLLYNKKV